MNANFKFYSLAQIRIAKRGTLHKFIKLREKSCISTRGRSTTCDSRRKSVKEFLLLVARSQLPGRAVVHMKFCRCLNILAEQC